MEGKIQRLEDLQAWVEARKLAKMVYEATPRLPEEERYGLRKHMHENARGVPANVAEGFGRYHYQESIQFYRIARGCLEEQKNDVYICFDRGYFDEALLKTLIHQIEKVEKLINGLVRSAHKAKSRNDSSNQ